MLPKSKSKPVISVIEKTLSREDVERAKVIVLFTLENYSRERDLLHHLLASTIPNTRQLKSNPSKHEPKFKENSHSL